jgi:hypothetical protein
LKKIILTSDEVGELTDTEIRDEDIAKIEKTIESVEAPEPMSIVTYIVFISLWATIAFSLMSDGAVFLGLVFFAIAVYSVYGLLSRENSVKKDYANMVFKRFLSENIQRYSQAPEDKKVVKNFGLQSWGDRTDDDKYGFNKKIYSMGGNALINASQKTNSISGDIACLVDMEQK